MKSEQYKRGYDAGYKEAMLDAVGRRTEIAKALMGRKLTPRRSKLYVTFHGPLP